MLKLVMVCNNMIKETMQLKVYLLYGNLYGHWSHLVGGYSCIYIANSQFNLVNKVLEQSVT